MEAELSLDGDLEGRRLGERFPCPIDLRLTGAEGRYDARVVNLSRSGVLVQVLGCDDAPPDRFAERIGLVFREGADVRFVDFDFDVAADLVRLSGRQARRTPLLACRFREPLAESLCARLGLPTDDDDG